MFSLSFSPDPTVVLVWTLRLLLPAMLFWTYFRFNKQPMKTKPVLLSKDGRQKKVYSRTLFLLHKSPKTDERPIGMMRLVDQDDAPKSRYYKKERKSRNRRSRASRDEDSATVEKVAAEEKMHLESLLNYVAFNSKDKRTFHNVESPPPPPAGMGRNNNDSSGNISSSNEEAYAEKVFHYPKPQFLHGRAVLSPYAPFFYETSNVVPPEVAPKRTGSQAETDEGNNNTPNMDVSSSPPSPTAPTGENKTVEESPKEKEEQMNEEKAEEQNEEEATNDTNQQEKDNSAKEEENIDNTATMTSPCTATTPTTTTTKTGEEENNEIVTSATTTHTVARTAGLNAKAVPFQPVDVPAITRNGVLPPTPPALGGGQPQHGALPWGPAPSGLHNTSTGLPPTSNDMSSMMGMGCMGPGATGVPYPPPFPQPGTMGMSMSDLMWMMYPWGMMQPPPPPGPPPKKKDGGAKNQAYGPKDSEYNRRNKHEWKDNWQAMHNTNGGRPLGSGTSTATVYKKNGSVHNSASAVLEKKYNNNSWSLSKVIGGRAQGTGALGIPVNNHNSNNSSSSSNNNINNTDNAAGAHNNGGGKANHYGKNNHAAPYGQPQYGAKKMWHASNNNVWSYHHSTNTPTQPRRMYGVKVA